MASVLYRLPVQEGPALPHLEEKGPRHIVGNHEEDTQEDGHRPPRDIVLVLEVTLLIVVLLGGCRKGLTEEERDIILIIEVTLYL